MIIGKNSALKGFALFAWLVVAILVLIPCVNFNAFFGVVGLLNLAIIAFFIVKLFNHFSS